MSSIGRFDKTVTNYLKGRPSYPANLLDSLHLPSNSLIVDVACGTGLSSLLPLSNNHHVIGIEPNNQMRQNCIIHPHFSLINGTAENTSLPNDSVDCIITAQAAHWFNLHNFMKESRRILKKDSVGIVALIWNDHDEITTPFHLEYTKICHATNDYSKITAMGRTASLAKQFFNHVPFNTTILPNRQLMTCDGLLSRFFSNSWSPPENSPQYLEIKEKLSKLFEKYKIPLNQVNPPFNDELIYDGIDNSTPPSPDLLVIPFQYETRMYFGNVLNIWPLLHDTHVHLTDEPNVEKRIQGTRNLKIGGLTLMGTKPSDWPLVKELSENVEKRILVAYGLHPWFTKIGISEDWEPLLRQYLEKANVVGEIGLDKVAIDPTTCTTSSKSSGKIYNFQSQIEIFRKQLNLAIEFKKPISLHMVQSTGQVLEELKKMKDIPKIQFHSYGGSVDTIKLLLKLHPTKIYFSLSHVINSRNGKFEDIVKAIPDDRIMLESDVHSPDLVDDLMLKICKEVARVKEWDIWECAQKTLDNARRFYDIE